MQKSKRLHQLKLGKNQNQLDKLRHSCAHLLAAAVLELWPKTKNTIGPAIENGFYYDFDFGKVKIAESDLPKIEEKMRAILKSWKRFEKQEVAPAQAKKHFRDNKYKLELINEFAKEGKKLTLYKSGKFTDLCRGGHTDNPKEELKHFKLLSIAGAYWRGSEKNKMLTRIYGTTFPSKEELEKYLWQQEEAKRRDHKKLGRELDLFSFHEEGPGFAFWHPKGMNLRASLNAFWQDLHRKSGYEEVSTPILLSAELWKRSGHWAHFKNNMYFSKIDKRMFALKPMNCPGMILIYQTRLRSYKDLPIRWRELGLVHRHEPSGTLNGLLRDRAFRQDDAHIFCRENQVTEEIKNVIKLTLKVYEAFDFEKVKIELSTRPKRSLGSDQMWRKAESALKKVLSELGLEYTLNPGDGAFYGPKIDFHLADSMGRLWQCGTIQLDFAMPEQFDLHYLDADGSKKRPVMVHRTIFGSVHRFVGILIEHFAGAFPVWLAPIQAIVLPITDRNLKYGQKVFKKLAGEGIRAEIDERAETLQAKIRDAQLQKIPYMLIVGDREEEKKAVAVRLRTGEDLGAVSQDEFLARIKGAIEAKSGL